MTHTEPPLIARWILERLVPSDRDDALAGDLHEEFCSGRSAGWYWRQVLSALAIRSLREIRVRYPALLFAAVWSMFAPVWLLSIAGLEQYFHLSEHFAKMDWPWSTLSDLSVMFAANLLFLWAGILLYLFHDLWLAKNLRLRELARGIRASLPALFVLWLALIALPKHFVTTIAPPETTNLDARAEASHFEQHRMWTIYYGMPLAPMPEIGRPRIALHIANLRGAIVDAHVPAMLARLPFFFIVLCTLWSASRTKRYAR